MSSCMMCGSPIPDGQNCCSMCYGDPDYGRDGYYRQWLEEQEREYREQEEVEQHLAAEAEQVQDEEQLET